MELCKIFSGGVNRCFEVTPSVYDAFQQCSGDHNPLHTDVEFARSKGFPDKVMYGNILNAFVSALVGEYLPTKDVIIQSQTIQYRLPVFMNDVLQAEMKPYEYFEDIKTVDFKFSFKNQLNKTVARGHVQVGVI